MLRIYDNEVYCTVKNDRELFSNIINESVISHYIRNFSSL